MLFVSMNCGHQRGLLFIPQVIHEQGEPWWNNIGRENLIRPPQLFGSPTVKSHLVAEHEEMDEGNDGYVITKYLCSYFEGVLTCSKIL
jgi:hypothetical protein